jgi:hypothetical protein
MGDGIDETISLFNEWQNIIATAQRMNNRVLFDESGRLASAAEKINERGPIKDRLAQTDEEAEVIAAADALRTGTPNEDSRTDEAFEDEIIERIADDIIEKTILRGI